MNLILQHYEGSEPDWVKYAERSFRQIEQEGTEYKRVKGFPMGKNLGFTAQKLCMLNEEYDEYENVLMIDMDTLYTGRSFDFWDTSYIGVLHDRAIRGPDAIDLQTGKKYPSRTCFAAPKLYREGSWCFFGNWIKLNREQRQELRKHWNQELFEEALVDKHPGDEIILHYLMHQSGILEGKKVTDICLRTEGQLKSLKYRDYNRFDRVWCNQPEDSDSDAVFIHFCAGRKNKIKETYKKFFGV